MTKNAKPAKARANSITAAEAAARMALSYERLVAAKAQLRAWRVAGAVWTLTVPYCKGWDMLFLDAIAEAARMDHRSVRRGLKEAVAAGALQWKPSRARQGGSASLVGLPDIGPARPHVDHIGPRRPHVHRATVAPLPTVEGVVRSGPQAGTHAGNGPQAPGAEGSGGSVLGAEQRASLTAEEVESFWGGLEGPEGSPGPGTADRFAPFHADERTGGVGDDEAAQLRWAGANPSKARRRG